ncbi:MAG: hypothetical protein GY716_07460 [bacterium]|nr:hypothetical protein [bacterium]
MRRILTIVLLLIVSVACSGDSDGMATPDFEIAGLWTLVADGNTPAEKFACSGDHNGMSGDPLCSPLFIDLQPLKGGGYGGTSTQPSCGLDWAMIVAVDGEDFSGQMVGVAEKEAQRFSFSGTVFGTAAIVTPGTFSIDGLSGNCRTLGFFSADW